MSKKSTARIDFSEKDCNYMLDTLLQFQKDTPDLEPEVPADVVANVNSAISKLKRHNFKKNENFADITLYELAAIRNALQYADEIFSDINLADFGIITNCDPPDFLELADRIEKFLLQCNVRFV